MSNCMDPSKLTSVERRQKRIQKIESSLSCHHHRIQFSLELCRLHDQLKTTYEIGRKSRFRSYLRVFFLGRTTSWIYLLSVPIFTKRKQMQEWVYSILRSFYWNRLSSWQRKFTYEELQLALELPQALKEPTHIVQFTNKRRCFNNRNKDTKCFT